LRAAREASAARLDATRLGRQVGHRSTLELLQAENDAGAAELALWQWRSTLRLEHLRLLALAGALDDGSLEAD
jgi:outer membrane protein